MKFNPFFRLLAPLVLGVSSLNASAALVLTGSGSTVDFYYDDAFWSNVTTSVVNDQITFAFQPNVQAAADDGSAFQEASSEPDKVALVVVAKSGYSFAGMPLGLMTSAAGSYALAQSGGSVSAFSGASVYEGSLAGGVFSLAQYLDDVSADVTAVSNDVAATSAAFGVSDGVAPSGNALAGPALGLFDVFYSVFALQDGLGESAISLDSLSYTVSANAMSTVPEPGSLVLLLSALGLAGWAGRGQTTRNGRRNTAV